MKKIILGVGIGIGVILVILVNLNEVSKIKFDRDIWEHNISQRNKIANYLINTNLLIGKTKEEIIRLLGKPNYINENILYYNIGKSDNYMSVDPNLLIIHLKNNKVFKIEKGES